MRFDYTLNLINYGWMNLYTKFLFVFSFHVLEVKQKIQKAVKIGQIIDAKV